VGGRTGQHGLAGQVGQAEGAAMPGRGGQPGAQRLELVMQPLLEDLAVGDQATPVTDRSQQGIHRVGGGWPPGALADQPDQRRTVTIIGLGAARAELGPGRLGSDGANSRTDPGQRRSSSATQAWRSWPVASTPILGAPATPLAAISPAKVSMPSRNTGNDTGSPISPRSPLVNQTRLLTLPGSTATTNAAAGTAWRNSSTTSHLLLTTSQGTSLRRGVPHNQVAQELPATGLAD
jgi:hypothetical protein